MDWSVKRGQMSFSVLISLTVAAHSAADHQELTVLRCMTCVRLSSVRLYVLTMCLCCLCVVLLIKLYSGKPL